MASPLTVLSKLLPSEPIVSAPKQQWTPWDASDFRVISKVTIRTNNRSTDLKAQAFQLSIAQRDGQITDVGVPQEIAIFENQDTLDLLPWFRDKKTNEIHFVVSEVVRAVLKDPHSINLPGAFLSENLGGAEVSQAAEYILDRKLGLTAKGQLAFLGNYLPSPSVHSEAVLAMSMEVEPLAKTLYDAVSFRDDPSRPMVRRRCLTANQIISMYENNEIRDGRLIDCVLRFCRQNKIDVRAPKEMTDWIWNADLQFAAHHTIDPQAVPMLGYQEANNQISENKKQITIATPVDKACGFLSVTGATATNINSEGCPLSEWNFEKIQAISPHSADILPWFYQDGEAYVVCQQTSVLGVAARKQFPHVIQADLPGTIICGISGFIQKNQNRQSSIKKVIKDILKKKTGITVDNEAKILLGKSESISPAYSDEIATKAFVHVDPASCQMLPNCFAIKVNDLIRLIDEGKIPDHRLSASVRLLEAALIDTGVASSYLERVDDSTLTKFSHEELSEFDQVVNQGSALHYVISRISPELHKLGMAKSITYRKALALAVNERGLIPMALTGSEDVFFRACIGIFTIYLNGANHQNINEFAGNASHDSTHHIITDFVPYQLDPETGRLKIDAQGNLVKCSREHYREIVTEAEIRAVIVSDDLIPREIGIEETEKLTWRGKQARTFMSLGLEHDKAAAEIRKIELIGEISPEVINSSAYQNDPAIRDAVRRVVKFGVLDKLQLDLFYDNWSQNPIIVETLLRYGTASGDTQEYYKKINSIFREIKENPEGVNSLKAENAAFCTEEILIPALRLSFAIQAAQELQIDPSPLYEAIDCLIDLKKTMDSVRAHITDINKTEENLLARRSLLEARETIKVKVRPVLESCCHDPDLLDEGNRQKLNQMLLPGFDSQMDYDRARADQLVDERIARSIAKAQAF